MLEADTTISEEEKESYRIELEQMDMDIQASIEKYKKYAD